MSLSWPRAWSPRGLITRFKVPAGGNDGGIIGKPVGRRRCPRNGSEAEPRRRPPGEKPGKVSGRPVRPASEPGNQPRTFNLTDRGGRSRGRAPRRCLPAALPLNHHQFSPCADARTDMDIRTGDIRNEMLKPIRDRRDGFPLQQPCPVVAVRGRDGQIHALHTSCRHRGSRVCTAHKAPRQAVAPLPSANLRPPTAASRALSPKATSSAAVQSR